MTKDDFISMNKIVEHEDKTDKPLMSYSDMFNAFNKVQGEVTRKDFVQTLMPMIMRNGTHLNRTIFVNFFNRAQMRLKNPPMVFQKPSDLDSSFIMKKERNMSEVELQEIELPNRVWEAINKR